MSRERQRMCLAQRGKRRKGGQRNVVRNYVSEMANNQFLLQLHREFPKFKTMLEGWDGQQFIWQKRNKAVMAQQFGVSVEDLRAEWDAAKRLFQKNRAGK